MNNVIAIIPARSGSKGVKNKNIIELLGHSLLEWSIKAAKKTKLIDRVFVSTDSEKYANLGIKYGAEVPFLRPAEISEDNSSDFSFISHSIEEFQKMNIHAEYLVHLRPTTPIRDPNVLDEAISYFQANKTFSSLRSVHLMSESSYKTLEINKGALTPLSFLNSKAFNPNSPRQSYPDTYQANGYIDILSTNFILKNHEIHGKKILPFITKTAYEIDTIDDLDYLEYLAKRSKNLIKKLFR